MSSGSVTTQTRRKPKRSDATGPYSRAQRVYRASRSVRSSCRWPVSRRAGGPGGRRAGMSSLLSAGAGQVVQEGGDVGVGRRVGRPLGVQVEALAQVGAQD